MVRGRDEEGGEGKGGKCGVKVARMKVTEKLGRVTMVRVMVVGEKVVRVKMVRGEDGEG